MIESIIAGILALFAVLGFSYGAIQKEKTKKIQKKLSQNKITEIEEKAHVEISNSDLDDLVRRGNELFPGKSGKSSKD